LTKIQQDKKGDFVNIEIMQVVYTTAMILLAFTSAIVVTKTVSKYAKKFASKENEEKPKE